MTPSRCGNSVSVCQTKRASASSADSAQSASRSSQAPGKRTTPMRGCGLVTRPLRELDLVALDQRVGEQLLAHPLHFRAGTRRVVRFDFEIDDPADTSLADREAELAQRRFD